MSRSGRPSAGVLALQSVVGNGAVSAFLLGDPGRALTADERSLAPAGAERTRVHSGPAVESVARVLGASAFTMDGAVYVGSPDAAGDRGRGILAHELVHALQQRRAGTLRARAGRRGDAFERGASRGRPGDGGSAAVPALQLLDRRDEATDALMAQTIAMLHQTPEALQSDVLIAYTRPLKRSFQAPAGPATRRAAARALLDIQRTLESRGVPPPFTPGEVVDWASAAQRERRAGAPSRGGAVPDPPFLLAPATGVEPTKSATEIATTAKEQAETPFERLATGRGGGAEVEEGMNALRSQTLGGISALVAGGIRESRARRQEAQGVAPGSTGEDNTTLDKAAGEIWFVANHLYLLDRTGHIVRGEFVESIRGHNLEPGTYFYTGVQAQDPGSVDQSAGLFRVDRGLEVAEAGRVLQTWTVLRKLALVERGRAYGSFAIIVSKRELEGGGVARLRGPWDLDPDKITAAMHRSVRYLPDAITSELLERAIAWKEHPGEQIAMELYGIGMEYVAKRFPPVGIALSLKESAELGAWLGGTASIAGHALSEDEIDIAAQAIARRLAAWLVDKAKAGIQNLAKTGLTRAATSLRPKPGPPPPIPGQPTAPPAAPAAGEEATDPRRTAARSAPSEATEAQRPPAPPPSRDPEAPPETSRASRPPPVPAPRQPSKTGGPTAVASSGGGEARPMEVVRVVEHGEKVADLKNEGKARTWVTGDEHALVTLPDGQRVIVRGGPGGVTFEKGQVKRIIAHTHPTNAPPSAADAEALRQLGQSQQTVLHGGEVTKVRPKRASAEPESTPETSAPEAAPNAPPPASPPPPAPQAAPTAPKLPVSIDMAEGSTVIWRVEGERGPIFVTATLAVQGDTLVLSQTHIQGGGKGTSSLREMKAAIQSVARFTDPNVKQVVVEPGTRTSGARPGHTFPTVTIEVP